MEYWIAVDANSAAGQFLLSLRGKIGGATNVVFCNAITHPLIVATDLDWSLHGFVRMTHHRNPGAENPLARELVLPSSAILLVTPTEPPAVSEQRGEQTNTPTSLH
jgi:hypothetical protein